MYDEMIPCLFKHLSITTTAAAVAATTTTTIKIHKSIKSLQYKKQKLH